ncbi:YuzD-like protein [Bacillus sp. JCM 19046]|uniref:Disulfide oxidoreductase YuzD n=1 Tax=Shouchella xiaoxiensis TaxID=766895 RepID=A0ABS2SS23_9BACI|nr:YuzD family protein [Shouchella xiaoxiensis]MBM7838297.1 disulfide oxidoreductase YuzD [Shouchella xiaoxiensis]GAF14471.1 YuzD-like protein [Bacillus sp. JCM 19045]GAF18604.1 YuzD-like protein [Bacillus sp. JCM 19046]
MATIQFTIYGAEQKCASCVHLPSARETMEWLEAALVRKYPEKPMTFHYVDIEEPITEEEQKFAEAILNDEYFYPLVILNGDVVAEGNPNLKMVSQKVDELFANS